MKLRRIPEFALVGAVAALTLSIPAHAAFTGYLKIPDIKGESQRASSGGGEAPITLRRTNEATAEPTYETIQIKYVVQADDHSAGDEHEIEFDIASTAAHDQPKGSARSGNEAAHVVQQRGTGTARGKDHKGWSDLQSLDWGAVMPLDRGSGMATGKRQHKPLTVTKELDKASPMMARGMRRGAGSLTLKRGIPNCQVGTRYDHIIVGEDGGDEVRLEQVTVARCAAEEVAFNYAKVGG